MIETCERFDWNWTVQVRLNGIDGSLVASTRRHSTWKTYWTKCRYSRLNGTWRAGFNVDLRCLWKMMLSFNEILDAIYDTLKDVVMREQRQENCTNAACLCFNLLTWLISWPLVLRILCNTDTTMGGARITVFQDEFPRAPCQVESDDDSCDHHFLPPRKCGRVFWHYPLPNSPGNDVSQLEISQLGYFRHPLLPQWTILVYNIFNIAMVMPPAKRSIIFCNNWEKQPRNYLQWVLKVLFFWQAASFSFSVLA